MDWYLSRWSVRGVPDGFQGSSFNRHWHCFGFNPVLAVRNPRNSLSLSTRMLTFSRRNTAVTYFPDTDDGNRRFTYFRQIVAFHPIKHTLGQIQWDLGEKFDTKVLVALITLLYVDIIDCTATLYSMARFCRRTTGKDKDFPRSTTAFCIDSICISLGALLGCSPVTAFIESGAGIAEGGRTGLTAVTAGFCFFLCIFFAPIFASIPPWATGCTLMLVSELPLF